MVTGGAHGIGLGIVERLLQLGAKVVASDVDREGLSSAHGRLEKSFGTSIAVHAGDLSKERGVQSLHRAVTKVFGPGRHPPSDSVFFYFLDPDGITVEYSFGMEEFAEHGARPPRYLEPAPESLDVWGAVPDGQFGRSGPIEREVVETSALKMHKVVG